MIATVFFSALLGCWMITVLTAFCPLRAYRRRQEQRELED